MRLKALAEIYTMHSLQSLTRSLHEPCNSVHDEIHRAPRGFHGQPRRLRRLALAPDVDLAELGRANLTGLVPGCIEAKFCKKIYV